MPHRPTIEQRGTSLRSSSAPTYQWYIDDAPLPSNQGGDQREIEQKKTGVYKVVVTSLVGCHATSDVVTVTIDMITATESPLTSSFTLFPNPATTHTTLEITLPHHEAWTISLYDLSQRLVSQVDITEPGEVLHHNIDVTDLPAGYYTVVLRSKHDIRYARLLKSDR